MKTWAHFGKAYGWLHARAALPREDVHRITDFDFRVFTLLDYYANTDRRAWPKQTTLAEELGCSNSGLRASLSRLETAGLIARRPGEGYAGNCNAYLVSRTGESVTSSDPDTDPDDGMYDGVGTTAMKLAVVVGADVGGTATNLAPYRHEPGGSTATNLAVDRADTVNGEETNRGDQQQTSAAAASLASKKGHRDPGPAAHHEDEQPWSEGTAAALEDVRHHHAVRAGEMARALATLRREGIPDRAVGLAAIEVVNARPQKPLGLLIKIARDRARDLDDTEAIFRASGRLPPGTGEGFDDGDIPTAPRRPRGFAPPVEIDPDSARQSREAFDAVFTEDGWPVEPDPESLPTPAMLVRLASGLKLPTSGDDERALEEVAKLAKVLAARWRIKWQSLVGRWGSRYAGELTGEAFKAFAYEVGATVLDKAG